MIGFGGPKPKPVPLPTSISGCENYNITAVLTQTISSVNVSSTSHPPTAGYAAFASKRFLSIKMKSSIGVSSFQTHSRLQLFIQNKLHVLHRTGVPHNVSVERVGEPVEREFR